MGLFDPPNKETHRDGHTTTRFDDGTSITKNEEGETVEETSHEHSFFFGLGDEVTVTRDGDGKIINAQDGWGKK